MSQPSDKKPERDTFPRPTRWSRLSLQYAAFAENNRPTAVDLARLRAEISRFERKPLVSILVPLGGSSWGLLENSLDSLLGQAYPSWELLACGPAGDGERELLARYERLDARITAVCGGRSANPPGACDEALPYASGEFVGVLEAGDVLAPDALFEMVSAMLAEPLGADLVYSDEDEMDERGERSNPRFKPGWSPDLLLSSDYISRSCLYRRSLLEEVGGFGNFGSAWRRDLHLRLAERTDEILHVPKVLLHSMTKNIGREAREEGRRAVSAALSRRGVEGEVRDGAAPGHFRVRREIRGEPKVSIVIPTRDNVSLLRRCVESIEAMTNHRGYEILIVDNDSADPETVEYLSDVSHRVVRFEGGFNYSSINNFAVSRTDGEHILLLNDDTEVISGEWLSAMLEQSQRPEVGAVGAKLLYPDGRIQHAGVVMEVGNPWTPGRAGHAYKLYDADSPSHLGTLQATCNYSAVTGACMMLRREVFEEVGGFDEENFAVAFNDVDLCLRIRERGYFIVYTPHAKLYHHESASRGLYSDRPEEPRHMRERWGGTLDNDPYYNSNFSLAGDFNLRADLMRPRVLREKNGEAPGGILMHPEFLGEEEFRSYVEGRRREARSSRRVGLV